MTLYEINEQIKAIMERLVEQMREKYHINVVGGEKPLDFPNDH